MNRWSRKKKWGLAVAVLACFPLLWLSAMFVIGRFNVFGAHQHCSKNLGFAFREYALDNDGKFPYHTNGFGDALLLLLEGGHVGDAKNLTAPGDDGSGYKAALTNQTDIDESKCSRVYIMGLSETNAYDGVLLVFDRYPTPGGDHFRRPWGKPIRDVVMADGSVNFISEERWPSFADEQIERLVNLGFNEAALKELFGVKQPESPSK